MERASGTVIAIAGQPAIARIEVAMAAACPRCAEGKGCGAGLFGRRETARCIEVPLPAGSTLAVGDVVSVDLAPRRLLEAAVIVYGWPLAGAAAGAAAAFIAGAGDVAAPLCTLLGLGGGVWLARNRLRRPACLRRFTPTIGR
ncbi:MAG: SoxR reducing system RseC family protein [Woeseiaceae bacterium]|nr:SoxR reducing system RseC family protein [Woeseiaceae bacterium]